MNNEILSAGGQKIADSASADIYEAGKKWFLSLDPSGDKLFDYRCGIKSFCNPVNVMGMGGPKKLDQLYISLRVFENQLKYTTTVGPKEYKKLESTAEEIARTLLETTRKCDVEQAVANLGYSDVLRDFDEGPKEEVGDTVDLVSEKRNEEVVRGANAVETALENDALLILGQPGGGKTTFMKYLALSCTGIAPTPGKFRPLLPIFVSLRELDRVTEPSPNSEWLLSFVHSSAKEIGGRSFNTDWLDNYLENGRCILLFDGIDEIPVDKLGSVLQSLNSFKTKYRKNKFVATCRVAAYSFALPGFKVCEIDDFKREDVFRFVGHWFSGDEKTENALRQHLKASDSVQDLCRTPLLLTLVCVLYEYSRSIPKNRAELYDECVNAMLFRWDTYRGIERSQVMSLTPQRKKLILSYIANYTFQRDSFYFRKSSLVSLIASQLERSGIDDVSAEEALEEIEKNNGLFIERSIGIYSFSHLTFHEYFTAESYVLARKERQLLDEAFKNSKFKEVFLLVLERLPSADEIIIALTDKVKSVFLDQEFDSAYIQYLLLDICASQVSMDIRLRECLKLQAEEFNRFIDSDFMAESVDEATSLV